MDKSFGNTAFVYGGVLSPVYVLYMYSAYILSFHLIVLFPVFWTEQLRVGFLSASDILFPFTAIVHLLMSNLF